MKNKIISLTFCFLLLFSSFISFITPDKYYSESEKRILTQITNIKISDIRTGKFVDNVEKYLTDQFPLRDDWISLKTIVELLCGKKEINDVYFSKDDYLIDKFTNYDQKQLQENIDALIRLNKSNKIKVMLIPSASEILQDKLPKYSDNLDQSEIITKLIDQGLDVIDPTELLSQHKNEYIYYKTDHHFTSLGAYYCYVAFNNSLNKNVDDLSLWQQKTLTDKFRGTTYSKVNYPFASNDTITAYYKKEYHTVNYNNGNYITDSIYEYKYLNGKDQYATFLNSNQATTVVSGDGQGKLLIIKDSYANCFTQFVIDDYSETHLIDPRFYKGNIQDYIEENGITEVLVLYEIPNFCKDSYLSNIIK